MSADFSCKGPDSTYLRLSGPRAVPVASAQLCIVDIHSMGTAVLFTELGDGLDLLFDCFAHSRSRDTSLI